MGLEVDAGHRVRMAHFDAAQQDMSRRIEGLREEAHLEFVPAPPERQGEFGRLLSDVPRPGIEDVHVLGHDRLSLSLSAHSGLSVGGAYEVRGYQVLYAYESNSETETHDEKQDKMQW